MKPILARREFLRAAAGVAAAGLAGGRPSPGRAAGPGAFSFVLLGDLHYDMPHHHDLDWLKREKPDDVRQVENYSRITREVTPVLLATVRAVIAERAGGAAPVAFILQVGDLVEGLCGTERLARLQNRQALEFVRGALPGVPFLFTKGNHDVTGPGAPEAFREVFHPFLDAQRRRLAADAPKIDSARFTVEHGGAQFVFFDAYDWTSLEWFEAVAAKRTAAHCFVAIHPPVVPYGARARWHLYSNAKDRARREKLLGLLGQQHAFVLGGHIHKFNTLVRAVGKGRFAQLALSSILSAPRVTPKDVLSGLAEYTGDQIRVEPKHSPATGAQRRAVYETERPFVKAFEYADLPGYAVVTVDGPSVRAEMFAGTSRELFRKVELDKMLAAGA